MSKQSGFQLETDKLSSDSLLRNHYYDLDKPGSFSGVNSFYRGLKEHNINIKKDLVKKWLQAQDTYTLHKPIIKKFKRVRYMTSGIDYIWQIDLIDIRGMSRMNKGYKYLFTCIDTFSKFAWVKPLKTKKAEESLKVFIEILNESKREPKKVHADQGLEFQAISQFLKKKNIVFYHINSDTKACIVERFNRTLKTKMFRKLTSQESRYKTKYIDFLDQLVDSYNNTYHRSIGTKPRLVTKKNSLKIWSKMYEYDLESESYNESTKIKFKIGDKVRITKKKNIFEKGYTVGWRKEFFIINRIILKEVPLYELKDQKNIILDAKFYESEIQKIES